MQRRFFSAIQNYAPFLSQVSKARKPSPIRALMPLVNLPGMISLGGGLPNAKLFPFQSLSFDIATGQKITLTPAELNQALQYSATPGLPSLLNQLKAIQQREHQPHYKDWDTIVTVGSQDALGKCFEMFLNKGDSIIVEEPTYPGTLAFLQPFGANLLAVKTDGYGLIPESLEQVLASNTQNKPKIIYTIPTGQNPSGSTLSLERRKKIYEIACKHDLIIMEDDPYYFLYYGSNPAPVNDADFVRPKVTSFFSMDVEGRVIRFDSFSKVLSSGVRIGWATGPSALIRQLEFHQQATSLHNSGVSQIMVSKLLETWGTQGLEEHLRQVALFYCRRRDTLIKYAEKHLTGLAKWTKPDAGMFIWFELLGVKDSMQLISNKAKEAKVLLIPGQSCSPNNSVSNCVRAAFSTASDQDMDTALERLATILKSA